MALLYFLLIAWVLIGAGRTVAAAIGLRTLDVAQTSLPAKPSTASPHCDAAASIRRAATSQRLPGFPDLPSSGPLGNGHRGPERNRRWDHETDRAHSWLNTTCSFVAARTRAGSADSLTDMGKQSERAQPQPPLPPHSSHENRCSRRGADAYTTVAAGVQSHRQAGYAAGRAPAGSTPAAFACIPCPNYSKKSCPLYPQ